MLGRALRKRCPNCGGGPLFVRWLEARERCPECRLRLERGERDYFLGSLTLNLLLSESAVAAGIVVALALGAGRWPFWELEAGGVALAMAAPIFAWPWTRVLWLAVDLMFRPATPDEFLS